jgi:hypothetical protein
MRDTCIYVFTVKDKRHTDRRNWYFSRRVQIINEEVENVSDHGDAPGNISDEDENVNDEDENVNDEIINNDTYETEINAVCDAFDSDDIDEECYDFQDELFNFEMIIEYSRDWE